MVTIINPHIPFQLSYPRHFTIHYQPSHSIPTIIFPIHYFPQSNHPAHSNHHIPVVLRSIINPHIPFQPSYPQHIKTFNPTTLPIPPIVSPPHYSLRKPECMNHVIYFKYSVTPTCTKLRNFVSSLKFIRRTHNYRP